MTDEELIARLRDGCNLQQKDGERAANRIEAMIAERDAAEAKLARMEEALRDATAHLSGAASAYRKYARRYTGLKPNGETDPFFLTRVEDFEKASLRARAALTTEADNGLV